jgi:prepilin-type N-terminal cleavage/methylation domain-containing protein
MRARSQNQTRAAFTLVELMVVILIISILSALLTVAISSAIKKGKSTRNQVEIRQLAAAVDAFKTANKVDYIPDFIYLSPTVTVYNQAATMGATKITDSYAYLLRLWPRLFANGPVDWTGTGMANPPDMQLNGDQCLVFFLGGIPSTDPATGNAVCTGFAKNPSNPAAHIGTNTTVQVQPPLFEFDSGRLVKLHNNGRYAYSYLDTYGTADGKGNWVSGMPYAYFSSYQTRNGYNRYGQSACMWTSSDCASFFTPVSGFPAAVYPYAQGVNQYMNPSGFQIISAGPDSQFGSGTLKPNVAVGGGAFWTPATAATSGASGPTGADDQSNFYDNLLGTPSIN